jgi:capsule polysaccharide export protein KpsE/RkpR
VFGDRHVIVMVSVTEEAPYPSGLLAIVTVMTLMTMIYGLILDRGCISTS